MACGSTKLQKYNTEKQTKTTFFYELLQSTLLKRRMMSENFVYVSK